MVKRNMQLPYLQIDMAYRLARIASHCINSTRFVRSSLNNFFG